MQFGPEGALYLLEYGTTWGTNADSRLVRIDFHAGNRPPVARIAQQSAIGRAPVRVRLSHAGSFDPDGDRLTFRWRVIWPDGRVSEVDDDPADELHSLMVHEDGVYSVELEVTDPSGASARASLPVLVGNSPPELAFDRPRHGGFVDPLEPIVFHVALADAEDDADDSPAAVRAQLERARVSARFVAGPPDAGSGLPDPPGLARMKASDCFNCHAREQRIVGPSLLEIAARYREPTAAPDALDAAVARVRAGSSGVWGQNAMLPHPQHRDEELRDMVAWILALAPDDSAPTVVPGVGGELPPLSSALDGPRSGSWVLEAVYTDAGAGPVGPLTARARLHQRTRTVEAEHASSRNGTQTLDSGTASGGRFVGAVDHGHWLRFAEVDLAGIASVACRVSSAGSGATVELRADGPDGAVLGSFELKPNGAWEEWFEVEVPLRAPPDLHDLFVVFRNETSPSALMNLDSLRFLAAPAASAPPSPARPR
jgi:cytochrome c